MTEPKLVQCPGAPVVIEKWGMVWAVFPTEDHPVRPLVGRHVLPLGGRSRRGVVAFLLGRRAIYEGVAWPIESGVTILRGLAHVRLVDKLEPIEVEGAEFTLDKLWDLFVEPHMLRWLPIIDAIGALEDT